MPRRSGGRCALSAAPSTLVRMKTLLKLALASALTAVLVRWARQSLNELPTVRPVRDAEPDVAEPLRAEDLRVAQNSPF
jgi:hypothetical protein